MKYLKNNKGGMGIFVLGLFIFLFLFVLIVALCQNYSSFAVVKTVHSVMEKTAVTAIARQTENTYASKRESNHGAYQTDGIEWTEKIQSVDGATQLNKMLKIEQNGDTLTKYTVDGSLLYRLSNIDITISNPKIKEKNHTSKSFFDF